MSERVAFHHWQEGVIPKGRGTTINDAVRSALACGDVHLHYREEPLNTTRSPDVSVLMRVRGYTICVIERDGVEVARGHALCSAKDQFCRRTGRLIAEGRARKRLAT